MQVDVLGMILKEYKTKCHTRTLYIYRNTLIYLSPLVFTFHFTYINDTKSFNFF